MKNQTLLHKLGGYYLIPHELLHVLAYRIIGKSCHYRWGDWRVKPLAERTTRERLFIGLLPFVVSWTIGFLFYGLWIALAVSAQMPLSKYLIEGPRWHWLCPMIASLFILYGGTAHGDLITSYYLLFRKKQLNDKGQKPQNQPDNQ